MRRSTVALALASTMIATPALARDGATYVELDGGIMFLDNMKFDIGDTNNAATFRPRGHDLGIDVDGFDVGGVIGHDFGMFRVEAEVSYREADAGAVSSSVRLPGVTVVSADGLTGGVPAGVYHHLGGRVSALSGMVNALLDFGPDNGINGFVGGGAGIARVLSDVSLNRSGPGIVDDHDNGFAWQALAGIRAPLTDSIDVGVKYRFFNVENVKFVDTSDRDMKGRWRSHSVMGSIIFNFGGARPVQESAPPPAPPPPPPPPPPPVYEQPAPPPAPPPPERPAERG